MTAEHRCWELSLFIDHQICCRSNSSGPFSAVVSTFRNRMSCKHKRGKARRRDRKVRQPSLARRTREGASSILAGGACFVLFLLALTIEESVLFWCSGWYILVITTIEDSSIADQALGPCDMISMSPRSALYIVRVY